MGNDTFTQKIKAFAEKAPEAVEAVFQMAVQDLVEDMQRPGYSVSSTKRAIASGSGLGKLKANGTRGKSKRAFGPVSGGGEGGNMPIDTGFLRASLQASTAAIPAINPAARPTEGKAYAYSIEDVAAAILAAASQHTSVFIGYTAAYAAAVEYGANGTPPRAFMRSAVQKWPEFVEKRAAQVAKRFGI